MVIITPIDKDPSTEVFHELMVNPKFTPQIIFQQALDELDGNDLDQVQACEKAYLASLKAIDKYILEQDGTKIRAGEPDAHSQRKDTLEAMALKGVKHAGDLFRLLGEITDVLHGGCYYRCKVPTQYIKDVYFKQLVPEILEKAGCY